jgi:hypothetical protein
LNRWQNGNTTSRLYDWVDNKLRIALEGTDCDDIAVKVSEGRIRKTGDCEYIFTCDCTSWHTMVFVGVTKGNQIKWIDSNWIHVYPLADPYPRFQMFRSVDTVDLNLWTGQFYWDLTDTFVTCPELWIESRYQNGFEPIQSRDEKITAYHVRVTRGDSLIFNQTNTGAVLARSICSFLLTYIQKGDKVIFDHIVCEMYQKEVRKLDQALIYRIE